MLGVPFIKRPLCYHTKRKFVGVCSLSLSLSLVFIRQWDYLTHSWESVVWFRSSLLLAFACRHRPARQQVIELVSARAEPHADGSCTQPLGSNLLRDLAQFSLEPQGTQYPWCATRRHCAGLDQYIYYKCHIDLIHINITILPVILNLLIYYSK